VNHWIRLATISLTVALCTGCNGKDGNSGGAPTKADYEQAIKALTEPVGLISAYVPYLEDPEKKDKGHKYAPRRRYDEVKAAFHAANEIRHATNAASQKFKRAKNKVLNTLSSELTKTTKACATPDEMPEVMRCKKQVDELNKVLEKLAGEAKTAGATGTFPIIGPASVTETAKKKIAPYKEALGPGKLELVHWATLKDEKATTSDVLTNCRAAHRESETVWENFENADPEVRKLAAIHMLAVKAQCDQAETTDGVLMGVRTCAEKYSDDYKKKIEEEEEQECKLVCANAKTRIKRGLEAAAFATLEKEYEDLCLRDATD
jgi:hypothetical protein